jgi:transcription termination factor Rho
MPTKKIQSEDTAVKAQNPSAQTNTSTSKASSKTDQSKNQPSYTSKPTNSRPRQGGYNNNRRPDRNKDFSNTIEVEGCLQILQDYGVLRQDPKKQENPNMPVDVYVSPSQIKKLSLRKGDLVKGLARAPKEGERYLSLLKVESVMGLTLDEARKRPYFAKLTPLYPDKRLVLETDQKIISTRLLDLVSPIGYGQRGLVVAPPKAGKTWLLREIANGVAENYPKSHLMVVLIGERPEEVTHMSREVKGEVVASNFDETAEQQTTVAELALERAKRMAEMGSDVVILLDSITRLARAYNLVVPPSGRTLSGGLDPVSLYPPKHFFGAARNLEEGGSLTILGTALVETGSKMDDVIYEEFKGTGNMELHLDRKLQERRIYPAINIKKSGTRHEERLFTKQELDQVFTLRRMIDLLGEDEATSLVIEKLKKAKTNKDFLKTLSNGS